MSRGRNGIKLGDKYGRLTVVEKTEQRYHGGVVWLCNCDCGNIASVSAAKLKNGVTQSCGCLVTENLTGRKFGRLTVLHRNGSTRLRVSLWECKCDCGKVVTVSSPPLRDGRTQSCGCIQREIAAQNTPKMRENNHVDGTNVGFITHTLKQEKLTERNTSGVTGVSWSKAKSKWVAAIGFQSKRHFLGYFDDIEEATLKRRQAEERYFGEYLGHKHKPRA